MKSWIITVGSEITSGRTLNTNASYISRCLSNAGIICERQVAVPDDPEKIQDMISEAIKKAPIVIVTGGLGPTQDDLTLEAISRACKRKLICVEDLKKALKDRYRGYGDKLTRLALRQSLVPSGAEVLENPLGTAPGLWIPLKRSTILALPGVPREMQAIMETSVISRLRKLSKSAPVLSRTIRTVGLVELQIQEALSQIGLPKGLGIGLYPHLGMVDIELSIMGSYSLKANKILNDIERDLRKKIGEHIYAVGDEKIEETVGKLLAKNNLSVSLAESCTGGLISDRITDIPGSSRYFLLTVVAYDNGIKKEILGVSEKSLAKDGAVSGLVAVEMAKGIRKLSRSDIGLSVTGIAGPGGATSKKPLGLVYIAISYKKGEDVKRFCFKGDRLAIKNKACLMALNMLRLRLLSQGPSRKTAVYRPRAGKSALE